MSFGINQMSGNLSKSLFDELKQLALSLGFVEFSCAPAAPFIEEFINYKLWLERGYHADMGYMERTAEKRSDPSLVLENAKTVFVAAYNYYFECAEPALSETQYGRISRHAWGGDYHEILKAKLVVIAQKLKEHHQNSENLCYVDTGPALEKQWAERSGLGWQGKNSVIISKRHGSFIFLGIIITTIELEEYPKKLSKSEGYCGSCDLCMKACPTSALVEPKVLDANKCISYWTVEAKADKEIPKYIAERLEGWLYGCDKCQNVCPWNIKFAVQSNDNRFAPRNGEAFLEIEKVLQMTQPEFKERFGGSPAERARLKRLKRNARALKEYFATNSNKNKH